MNARNLPSSLSLLWSRARKIVGFARAYGLSSLRTRYIALPEYEAWIASCDTLSDAQQAQIAREIPNYSYQPRISVVMPVYNAAEAHLREAIESVRRQVYPHWELCIADDNSTDASVRKLLDEYSRLDPRIRSRSLSSNTGISAATNAAVELARGDFLGFLDQDDLLREHALSAVVRELNKHSDAELLFTDEDRLSPQGQRYKPYFKSGWNPELMLSHNAVCHFMVVRTTTFRDLGGMRSSCDGAQDWDLALRISERVQRAQIRHIPEILYHWRESATSTALNLHAKPYVNTAQQRVVREFLERRGEGGVALEFLPYTSMLRPRFVVAKPMPRVSVILLERALRQSQAMLRWARGLVREYSELEVLVVGAPGRVSRLAEFSAANSIDTPSAHSAQNATCSEVARMLNDAAFQSTGSILCFVQGAVADATPGWLVELVAQVQRCDVGAVGPIIVSEQGEVHSAGLLVGKGHVCELFSGVAARSLGNMYRVALARDVSALPATCLVVRKAVFDAAHGFDVKNGSSSFFDVNLSRKLIKDGYRVICTPQAKVTILSGGAQGDKPEPGINNQDLTALHSADPLWNPNLSPRGTLCGTLR
jgi:glycosyltransferase involved in cell wall biosynthesis